MDIKTYDKILDLINKNRNLSRGKIYHLIVSMGDNFKISDETFTSIYANLKRRQMFKPNQDTTHCESNSFNWRHLKDNSINLCFKYNEYEQEENRRLNAGEKHSRENLILKISNDLNISPVLMVRLILDGFIRQGTLELAESAIAQCKDKVTISNLIKETHLLKNGRLAYEIWECCCMDDDYGPTIDVVRNLIGIEHEMKLEKLLTDRNISFVKENVLRERGYDKTPDFMLEVPICLKDGTVICWIDSKATFGDEQSHKDNYENQFKFYLNRFGSGLVIYWFGYLNTIESLPFNFNSGTLKKVISIDDKFPNDVVFLNLDQLLD